MRNNSRRAMAGTTLALIGSLVMLAAGSASAAPLTEKLDPGGGTRAFWTPERIERAAPLDTPRSALDPAAITAAARKPLPPYISQPVADPTAVPFRTAGKVLFKLGGRTYSCSAAIVKAPSGSLIWTAGHCLRDPGIGGRFVKKLAFAPAYDNGSTPFGVWSAKRVAVPRGWGLGNQHFDFGAAVLRKREGVSVQRAVGEALPFDTNPKAKQSWAAVGYPQANRFGDNMWTCLSKLFKRDRFRGPGPNPLGIGCDMAGGASGGPWLTQRGKLGAVSAYVFRSGPDALYGTYMGKDAKRLYKRMR